MSKEQRESATFMQKVSWIERIRLNLDEYANIVNNDVAIDSEINKLKKKLMLLNIMKELSI